MTHRITVLAPITLARDKTEEDLIEASDKFQKTFVDKEPGVLRRELIRTGDREYMDIVQFRSKADAEEVIAKEMASPVCHEFFAVMEMGDFADDPSATVAMHDSLATYN